jgi:hypothetical protein
MMYQCRLIRGCTVMMLVVGAAMCALMLAACSGASAPDIQTVAGGQVMMVPEMSAGWAGWCVAIVTRRASECANGPGKSGPILSESWSAGGSVTEGAALTTSEVATVAVNGSRPIATQTASAVAGALGLRSVIVEVRSKKLRTEDNKSFPRFTSLNAKGAAIRRPVGSEMLLGFNVPTRSWQRPQHAPSGVCEIMVEDLPGLSARWGAVVTAVRRSYQGLLGRPFLSCASTEYFRGEEPLEAGVLLDAARPGAEPPPLPAMRAVRDHPGIFQAQGAAGEGQMVGRRIAHAWLVVEEGGSTLQQRIALLERLRATVRL